MQSRIGDSESARSSASASETLKCPEDRPKLVILALVNPPGLPSDHMLVRTARRFGLSLRFMFVNQHDPLDMVRALLWPGP